jgi:hypothetical protein
MAFPEVTAGSRDSAELPTDELGPYELEEFVESLLSAHRFSIGNGRRIVSAKRWGRQGDKQDGIDLKGRWSDDATAVWQCRRWKKLTSGDVTRAVAECAEDADEHYLVFSGVASAPARKQIGRHPSWDILDKRDMRQLLFDLPLHRRRDLLDRTWGETTRKQILRMPGADTFETIDSLAAHRLTPPLLNDRGILVGRELQLADLDAAFLSAQTSVALITGPAGFGKARLALAALTIFQDQHPTVPVLSLLPERELTEAGLTELPHSPAVVFVANAHERVGSVALLLQYATRNPGTRLVLTTTRDALETLQQHFTRAALPFNAITTIDLTPLTSRQAYQMVDSLADGLNLSYPAKVNIARLALEAPYLGVIATNSIRNGTLSGNPALNVDLRAAAHDCYRRSLSALAGEHSPRAVQRLLAAVAAIGAVLDLNDEALRAALAEFCGLSALELDEMMSALIRGDVLRKADSMVRLVPDIVADIMLEGQSINETLGEKTGFVDQVWERFYPLRGPQLLQRLTDLDWRLRQSGLPTVVDGIWATVHRELAGADMAGLARALDRLRTLCFTQTERMLIILDDIAARVSAAAELPGSADDETAGGVPAWLLTSWADVAKKLPDLYVRCALAAPETLEHALDALWALHQRLAPLAQSGNNATVQAARRLASIGTLPNESFAYRIVERVAVWLTDDIPSSANPLFLLEPLLAKEGDTARQTSRQVLTIQRYGIDAAWAGPVRGATRAVLQRCAAGQDISLAAAAIRLLQQALAPPLGIDNARPTDAEVAAWQADDLQTIGTLRVAAETTQSAVVRRMIRQAAAFTAELAIPVALRHAALTLVTALDELDDDLAEMLLQPDWLGLACRRGRPVPTIEELSAGHDGQDDTGEGAAGWVQRRQADRQNLTARVVQSLWERGSDEHQALDAIEVLVLDVLSCKPTHQPLWWLGQYLGTSRCDLCRAVVIDVAARPPGPLDELIAPALAGWALADGDGLGNWLRSLGLQRTGVKVGVATAFERYNLTDYGGEFLAAYQVGRADANPIVRAAFHVASHRLLALQTQVTAESLVADSIGRGPATRLLQLAAGPGTDEWIATVDEGAAHALLEVAARADLSDYSVQMMLGLLVSNYPRLVLDSLTAAGPDSPFTWGYDDIASGLRGHEHTVVDWILDRLLGQEPTTARDILGLVVGAQMWPELVSILTQRVVALDVNKLGGLIRLLGDRDFWPLQAPDLARAVLTRAADVAPGADGAIIAGITTAARAHFISWLNGRSAALETALELCTELAAAEHHAVLRAIFTDAATVISAEITQAAADLIDEGS